MTVSVTDNKFRYEGNGSTDTFSFPARVYSETDLVVEIITRATDALVETLTITTHYTVTIASNGTASVQVTSAPKIPSALQDIQIYRSLPASQTLALPTGTVFPAKSVETRLDYLTSLVQDKDEILARSVKIFNQSEVTDIEITDNPSAGKSLKWNATADALINSDSDPDNVVDTATTQAGIATAAAATATTQAGLASTAKTAAEVAQAAAELAAATVTLPTLGAANETLQVNLGGTSLAYGLIATANLGGDITAAGKSILDDADNSEQRTTLGLGTAAVAALIDDDTMATATASNIPSAESVKAYIDARYNAASVLITGGTITGVRNYTFTATIADDAATSFTPPTTAGLMLFGRAGSLASWALGFFATGSGTCLSISEGSLADINLTSGTLTGTTGTDGQGTIRANSGDGKIYIENRSGASNTFTVTIVG